MGGASVEPGASAGANRDGVARARAKRESDASPSADSAVPDLQDLLAGAVQMLARATGATRVAAWARRVDGSPFVAAAAFEREAPRAADTSVLEAIWASEGAIDLGMPGLPPALAMLVEHHGFGAAAPLFSRPGEPLAVLLLGGDADRAGSVRPRTLANLDAAIRRLRAPATTAASVQRLARLDGEVQRLDRLAALGELLSEAVHELRNPLVSFKTFVELAPDRATDPEFLGDFRNVVSDEIRRMERLLDDLLRQARPASLAGEAADAGPADVTLGLESLQQLLQPRSRQREVALAVAVDRDLPALAVADDVLRQILLNLALNAIDATPAGGKVTLSAHHSGSQVVFCIDDQGSGIAHDQRDHIFLPFFSTRSDRPGGLGLAISRKLVDEAGGRIEVGDAPNGGARFRVSLPIAHEPVEHDPVEKDPVEQEPTTA